VPVLLSHTVKADGANDNEIRQRLCRCAIKARRLSTAGFCFAPEKTESRNIKTNPVA
jgi:hypothetical protein